MMISLAFLRDFASYLKHDTLGVLGLVIVVVFVIVGILAPYIVPYPEDAWGLAYNVEKRLQPPSINHPFGTDEYGRDVFSRVILGARFSLIIALGVVSISLIIGVFVGLIAGYMGGWLGTVLMRITDMFLAFPSLLLAVVFASVLGRGLENVIIALSLSWWPWYARLTYVQVSNVKNMPYVEAAKVSGIPLTGILLRYILPNSLTPVTIQAFLDMGAAILEAAALSFIGVGVKPPTPEWGLLISEGWTLIGRAWWISLFPGLALFLTVLGFNLLADAFREYNNPRVRRLSEARV